MDDSICGNACGSACYESTLEYASRRHVEDPVQHDDLPPAGGDHDGCWAEWGLHTEPVPSHNWVHNLEHGGVALLYNCPDGCESELATIQNLAESLDGVSWLLTPYPEMETRFGVVAWGQRMLLDCVDSDAYLAFIAMHANNAPEAVASAPPAGCL